MPFTVSSSGVDMLQGALEGSVSRTCIKTSWTML